MAATPACNENPASALVIDGVYRFAFENVAPGNYFVIAGTDSDNDGVLCDAGESCGGYPLVSLLQSVRVDNANIADLAFESSFSPRIDGDGSWVQGRPIEGLSCNPGPRPGS